MRLDFVKCCFLVAVMMMMVVVCFRESAFVGWGARRRCCGMVRLLLLLLRSVGLEGGERGGGGLGCSVVGLGVVEAFLLCFCGLLLGLLMFEWRVDGSDVK